MSKLQRALFARLYRDQAGSEGGDPGAGAGDNGQGAGAGQGAGEGQGNQDGDKGGKGGEGDQGGKKPSDNEAELLKEVMKRKESEKVLKSQLEQIQAELGKFKGVDIDLVNKLLKDHEDAETAKLEAKGEWERLKAQMADAHGKEKEVLQQQIQELNDKLNQHSGTIEHLTVGQSFAQSKFISDDLTLTPSKARTIYGSHFDIENGAVVAYDKPRGSANRTPLVDAKGDALLFDAALKQIVEADPDKDTLLKSKARPGAGSKQQPGQHKPAPAESPRLKGIDRIRAGLTG